MSSWKITLQIPSGNTRDLHRAENVNIKDTSGGERVRPTFGDENDAFQEFTDDWPGVDEFNYTRPRTTWAPLPATPFVTKPTPATSEANAAKGNVKETEKKGKNVSPTFGDENDTFQEFLGDWGDDESDYTYLRATWAPPQPATPFVTKSIPAANKTKAAKGNVKDTKKKGMKAPLTLGDENDTFQKFDEDFGVFDNSRYLCYVYSD